MVITDEVTPAPSMEQNGGQPVIDDAAIEAHISRYFRRVMGFSETGNPPIMERPTGGDQNAKVWSS